MTVPASRLAIHNELLALLGSSNVYYSPPESLKLKYPAIVYSRLKIHNNFANNGVYKQGHQYQVIIIDQYPDSETVEKMSKFHNSRHLRHYVANNLNHDVFEVHYDKL